MKLKLSALPDTARQFCHRHHLCPPPLRASMPWSPNTWLGQKLNSSPFYKPQTWADVYVCIYFSCIASCCTEIPYLLLSVKEGSCLPVDLPV
ncbi:hypothetical protein CCHR01_17758 [Colletotrichum chrysophilum]|uniref:Uncharacterized protein n=1 Tax=Colletotrichum chrysophilum TaxID=1836956 RepID=A0AAD9A5W7_9PEZI|nr:hypothetical protein CCHR01_17758 [Colletotrichum chrysophilum]